MSHAPLLSALFLALAVNAEDADFASGVFKSGDNRIREIHIEISNKRNYMVLKLEKKLEGRNARSRSVTDKRSNYGDSAATYAYLELKDGKSLVGQIAENAQRDNAYVDLFYACGDQPDDKKRIVFPFFAETNCEVEAITIKAPKERRGFF